MNNTKSSGLEHAGEGRTGRWLSPTVLPTTAAAAVPVAGAAKTSTANSSRATSDAVVFKNSGRRWFPVEYKLRILREVDQCSKRGQIGAILRREGLYFSHLSSWRRERTEAIEAGVMPKRRGRKPKATDSLSAENKRLLKENRRLMAKLRQIAAILDIPKELLQEGGRSPPSLH